VLALPICRRVQPRFRGTTRTVEVGAYLGASRELLGPENNGRYATPVVGEVQRSERTELPCEKILRPLIMLHAFFVAREGITRDLRKCATEMQSYLLSK
jgi:hypothetical protein